ncbi:short-chain dehydrogenase [Xylaria grammica]|nr:short-chain dehydrogenase [Xylaria grammica]
MCKLIVQLEVGPNWGWSKDPVYTSISVTPWGLELVAITFTLLHGTRLNGIIVESSPLRNDGGGIGKALAQHFISNGKKVIIAGRMESKLQQACKEIRAAAYSVLDTGVVSEIPAIVRRVVSEHPELDCLVNNAGVQRPLSVVKMAPEEFLEKADQEIDINTRGPMHLALHFLSHLRAEPHAVIINVSSVLGFAPFALINPIIAYNMINGNVLYHRGKLDGTNARVVGIVPPTVVTDLHREREDPDGNKKSSNPSTLSVDEFIAEISKPLEDGDETIGAGMGVSLAHR